MQSNTYNSFNTLKFDTSNEQDKYQLYIQFVAWYFKGSSIVPLSDYAHNPAFQELLKMNKYFAYGNEKLFIDLERGKGYTRELEKINRDDSDLTVPITLKAVSTKKMRLCVTGYYQGEHIYTLSNEGSQ